MSLLGEELWSNGPTPGALYQFPSRPRPGTDSATIHGPAKLTLHPTVTGTSVLGVTFEDGVMIACDTLGSYGSMARYNKASRLLRVNDSTVMGADGDFADFQFLKSIIEQKVVADECACDGVQHTPLSLFSWLTRVMYNRRSKFNPLWNTMVVGGMQQDKPFLGYVDKIGTAYEAPSIATGYGAYIAQPLLRDALEKAEKVKQPLTEAEAKALIQRCMTVLYYRDARAWNKYEIATIKKGHAAVVEGPFESTGDWSVAHYVGGYE